MKTLKEMNDIEKFVDRSAYSLDEFRPGWEREIDVDALKISDPKLCIMAQLFGEFTEPFDRFVERFGESEAMGFHCSPQYDAEYSAAWKSEIEYRLKNNS